MEIFLALWLTMGIGAGLIARTKGYSFMLWSSTASSSAAWRCCIRYLFPPASVASTGCSRPARCRPASPKDRSNREIPCAG